MTARIFISYRSADGVDKATALARDLGEIFGDAMVFLDKDDLTGGSAWRGEIEKTLGARPVLLVLITSQLLAPERIAEADDPVRRELETALAAQAHVIPLLCDGTLAPDCEALPAPFNRLGEFTWRPLRAYDWRHDLQRLLGDLAALGIERPKIERRTDRRQRRWPWLAVAAALLLASGLGWWLARPGTPATLTGRWQASLWQGEQVVVALTETDGKIALTSAPIAIAARPDWAAYRQFWLERTGAPLDSIAYRGEGRRLDAPGVAPAIDIGLQVLPSPHGSEVIDSGNLSATLAPDGRTLTGRLWLNGAQAEQPARLERLPD